MATARERLDTVDVRKNIRKALIVIPILAIAIYLVAAIALAMQTGTAAATGAELRPPTCTKVAPKTFNQLLRRREQIGGRAGKPVRRPVCVRPRYRRLQAQVNRLERECARRGDPLCRWLVRWRSLSQADRRWTTDISSCEVRAVWPDLVAAARFDNGNGFYGAFQWLIGTWHSAGGSGSPVDASWHEQAVRAVRWRNKAGTSQWPACSRRHGYL